MTQEKLNEYIAKIKQSIQRKHEIEARMDAHLQELAEERAKTGNISVLAH